MTHVTDIAQLVHRTCANTVACTHVTEYTTTLLTFNLQQSHNTIHDTATITTLVDRHYICQIVQFFIWSISFLNPAIFKYSLHKFTEIILH